MNIFTPLDDKDVDKLRRNAYNKKDAAFKKRVSFEEYCTHPDAISFLGVELPIINTPLPSLLDQIKPIEPLVLSPAEEKALHKRFREKFGVDLVITPGVPIQPNEGM